MRVGIADVVESRSQVHMGTFVHISLEKSNASHFQPSFEVFRKLDQLLSHFKESSEISRLNKDRRLKVSPETLEILFLAREYHKLTEGYFDVTLGALTIDTYQFNQSGAKIPTSREIKKALPKIGMNTLKINQDQVELETAGVKIDLGGIGKGYAVDKASLYLRSQGVSVAQVAASGDIRCFEKCEFSIANPFLENSLIGPFFAAIENLSISTSGNYQNFVKSKKTNHLLNPKTGQPQQIFARVTLFSKSENTKIDALATAVSVMPLRLAEKILREQSIGYILILNDGSLSKSQNLDLFVDSSKIDWSKISATQTKKAQNIPSSKKMKLKK